MKKLHSVADWMQLMDPNGNYEDVTEQDIPDILVVLRRWQNELPENDPKYRGCTHMMKRLEALYQHMNTIK